MFYSYNNAILSLVSSYTGLYLILLTYKGKILLLQRENIINTENTHAWHFIKKERANDASAETTIIQEVRNETQVLLDNVTLISKIIYGNTIQYLFHSQLSDKNVNNIKRGEGRLLQFFGLNELNKLQIQPSTKMFFLNDKSFFENLSVS